jgi:hypothetical protein
MQWKFKGGGMQGTEGYTLSIMELCHVADTLGGSTTFLWANNFEFSNHMVGIIAQATVLY